MKLGNEAGLGKQSVPGKPVAWRRLRGEGPLSIIAQAGEPIRENYGLVTGNPEIVQQLRICNVQCVGEQPYTLSPETGRLVEQFRRSL